MKTLVLFAGLLALVLTTGVARAEVVEAAPDALVYRHGDVQLRGGLATLKLGQRFKFLETDAAETVLQRWGNPPGMAGLGMLLAEDASPFVGDSWAVIVQYEEDGHVDDEDAASIDYGALLETMKESTERGNREREKQGYPAMHLVGWAEPPHYDAAAHKLYWAKDLDFAGAERTLNYDIRVLGRKGVLQLSAVAKLSQLDAIKRAMPEVLAAVEFNQGARYADYVPDADALAGYGLGALIIGKSAAKLGFFALALKLLVASKKIVAVVLLGAAALAKRLTGRRKLTPA